MIVWETLMTILFYTQIPEEKKQQFEHIAGTEMIFCDKDTITDEMLEDAEVIFGNPTFDQISKCRNLKWIQLNSAGANTYKDLDMDIQLTNASGAYGTAISEHILACVLMVQKNLARYLDLQKAHEWINLGSVHTITTSKVLCIGMGDIGSNVARRMHALGAEVIGIRRNVHDKPDYVSALYTMKDIDSLLPEADIVTLSLPETEETIHMFDERRLRLMKPGSILVNVGRGSAIVTNDLVKVMKDEHLAGVCLDVTDPEPLPKNHALWNTKHVYITPHISGRFNAEVTLDLVLNIFRINLAHYMNGEPLEHVVDRTIGY